VQNGGTNRPTGPIVAAIGGGLLALGSVMTWATASLNLDAFKTAIANALGIDPSQIPVSGVQTSKSFAGTSGSDGKVVLVCGIVVLLVALAVWARPQFRVPVGILAIVGGLVGGGFALYDIGKKGDIIAGAKDAAAPALAQVGLDTSILDQVFKVSLGIGIYLCVVAGAVTIVGGLLILTRKGVTASPAMAGTSSSFEPPPPPADMGFGATVPPAPSAMPEAPGQAPTPAMDASPTQADAEPSVESTEGPEDPGGTSSGGDDPDLS